MRLFLWWQPGDGNWYASMEHPVGTPVVQGRRIVVDEALIWPMPTAFRGDIFCRPIPRATAEGAPARGAWADAPTHVLRYEPVE